MEENIQTRRRAIELCNNLQQTIRKMGDFKPIESLHTYGFKPRANKNWLMKHRSKIIERFNLNKKELR